MIGPRESPEAWTRCIAVARPALLLAPRGYLRDVQDRLFANAISAAVARHNTPVLFDWVVGLLSRQGISNRAAEAFNVRHGSPTFVQISDLMAAHARCPRLGCHWAFDACCYRRSTSSCGTPHHRVGCPVTLIPARKGSLAEAAVGLWLFIRDVCDDDFVGWIDARLASVDDAHPDQLARMRAAVLEPLVEIPGTGPKVWSMILAELLLGTDSRRSRWMETGASFVAVDTLVHAYLHRTGVLRRLDAEHACGTSCYARGGCADIIAALADRIDAREFDPSFPANFPRFVQFAFWWFCAADGWATCNGNTIDDSIGCRQRFCPCSPLCKKIVIKPI